MSVADDQQDSETAALETVISLANETLFDLINATITANYTTLLDALDTLYADDTSNVSTCLYLCAFHLLKTLLFAHWSCYCLLCEP